MKGLLLLFQVWLPENQWSCCSHRGEAVDSPPLPDPPLRQRREDQGVVKLVVWGLDCLGQISSAPWKRVKWTWYCDFSWQRPSWTGKETQFSTKAMSAPEHTFGFPGTEAHSWSWRTAFNFWEAGMRVCFCKSKHFLLMTLKCKPALLVWGGLKTIIKKK